MLLDISLDTLGHSFDGVVVVLGVPLYIKQWNHSGHLLFSVTMQDMFYLLHWPYLQLLTGPT